MSFQDISLRWTVLSVFEKHKVTYRTQARRTVGSASMRPLPYLPRFLLDADSEIATKRYLFFMRSLGPTTGLCSLLSQRNLGPSP